MKFWLLISGLILSSNLFAQVLDGAQQVNLFVHASEGLALRAEPDYHSKELKQIEYGTELVIISYQDTTVTLNGFKGKWAEVIIDKQKGYVFDAYLSDWPVVKLDDYDPDLKDYIYAVGVLTKGDQKFEISDAPYMSKKAAFDLGDYTFYGDECNSDEKLQLKGMNVQEAYVVFSGFMPTYGEGNFVKKNFEWDKEDGVWVYNFEFDSGEFTHWHHITYTKNKQDEFDYMEVYFDWEGGGGSLKITGNKKMDGVTVKKFYGCH